MQVTIIGNISEKEEIAAACARLKNYGVDATDTYPTEDQKNNDLALNSPIAILWISPNAGKEVYNSASLRNQKRLTTINYFAKPTSLSDLQKQDVGRNRTIFATLSQDFGDIVNLITNVNSGYTGRSQRVDTSDPMEPNASNSSVVEGHHISVNNPVAEKGPLSTPDTLGIAPQETFVPEESEEPDWEEEREKKRILWRPWLWIFGDFINYCIWSTGIIKVYSDSVWFLVIGLGFFFFAYKIVTSSIKAIKISKWAHLTLLISIFFGVRDILRGIEILDAYF